MPPSFPTRRSSDLADYFEAHYTAEPTVLFRIFRYPPTPPARDGQESWGVGEHSDYGLLTLLAQDEHGGLQVKTPGGWIAAPPLPGTLRSEEHTSELQSLMRISYAVFCLKKK